MEYCRLYIYLGVRGFTAFSLRLKRQKQYRRVILRRERVGLGASQAALFSAFAICDYTIVLF
jgi:hypothetical protein